ncbi:MAG: PLP-dependent aminotransferase family protein [Eubacterium sp.]|jgi:GntR family transcriptional regulator/MocR family aminotransferase|nr:PLP-dependent aminotransferase family protein [Eubacterium sp.]
MIVFNFDKNSPEPMYIQIFNKISKQIDFDNLTYGTKLPSQRELAKQLGISVNTIIHAYDMLKQHGYINSSDRSGHIVCKDSDNIKPISEVIWHTDHASVYNFSVNGVDLTMTSNFKKTLRYSMNLFIDRDFKFPYYTGDYELRKSICSMLYKTQSICCSPTQIIIGSSVELLLDSLIRVMGHDLTYAFENPVYYKIIDFIRLGTSKIEFVNVCENGILKESLSELEADVLFLMPFHQFPLGVTMSFAQKSDVIGWAKEGRYIIEFGYDMEFVHTNQSEPIFSISQGNNVIFMGDFKKSISPEINVAYLVLPVSIVKLWSKKYYYYHTFTSEIEQKFVAEVIKNGSYYQNIKRLSKLYLKKQQTLISCIREHRAGKMIRVLRCYSGTFVTIEALTDCSVETLMDVAAKAGIKFLNIAAFFKKTSEMLSKKLFILGFGGLEEKEIEEGIKLLLDSWMIAANL